jgi:hypothetical protein
MPDDLEYMTAEEFADLPSDAHHTVWAAHAKGLVDASAANGGVMRRYHRAQVIALLLGLEPVT